MKTGLGDEDFLPCLCFEVRGEKETPGVQYVLKVATGVSVVDEPSRATPSRPIPKLKETSPLISYVPRNEGREEIQRL